MNNDVIVWENFANAIVEQAVNDYANAIGKKIRPIKRGRNIRAEYTINECERFFKGEWIKNLTRLDGVWLMEQGKNLARIKIEEMYERLFKELETEEVS